jgi:hypothetical protein
MSLFCECAHMRQGEKLQTINMEDWGGGKQ